MSVDKRTLRLAGLLATGIALSGLWVVAAFWPRAVPFPPTSLAEAIIRAVPGDVSTFFIDLLKHWAIRLLAVGVGVGTLAFGAFALQLLARGGEPKPFVVGVLLAVVAAIAIVLGPGDAEDPLRMVIALGGAAALYGFTAGRFSLLHDARETGFDESRRRALRLGVGGAAGIAVAGGALGWFASRFGGPDTNVDLLMATERAMIPTRPDFPDIPGLSPEITSAADHYVVDINLVQPSVEVVDWDLKVHGLVDMPLQYTFDELQSSFDIVEEYSVLSCISNEVGGSLVGNSLWGGVRLRDVLERAGIGDGAVDVVFTGDEGYTDSIPIEVAMDPSVILAVSQNRKPLTQEHGFPCRVRVPMIYGMKNVKWLREIEVVDNDYQGYWMERGWSDEAIVRTQSRIDVAGENRRATVGTDTWIAGVAWAGARGISKVEVSTDDGNTWSEAMLRDPVSPYAWTQWAYRWTPEATGRADVVVRATDGDGKTQTKEESPPHPAGSTGWHSVSVAIT